MQYKFGSGFHNISDGKCQWFDNNDIFLFKRHSVLHICQVPSCEERTVCKNAFKD